MLILQQRHIKKSVSSRITSYGIIILTLLMGANAAHASSVEILACARKPGSTLVAGYAPPETYSLHFLGEAGGSNGIKFSIPSDIVTTDLHPYRDAHLSMDQLHISDGEIEKLVSQVPDASQVWIIRINETELLQNAAELTGLQVEANSPPFNNENRSAVSSAKCNTPQLLNRKPVRGIGQNLSEDL